MRLFAGLGRTDYQDVLRAIGRLLDIEGACAVRLLERDDGLLVQLRRASDPRGGFETRRLGDAAILELMHGAYLRRGTGTISTLRTGHLGPGGASYQDLLRAVGRVLDSQRLREVRLVERAGGVTIQARPPGELSGFVAYRLPDEALRAWVLETLIQRETSDLVYAFPDHAPGRA